MSNPFDKEPSSEQKPDEPKPFKRPPPPPSPQTKQKRLGWGMYAAGTLIALALLTQLFSWALESKEARDGVVVRIVQQTDGHYYAQGEINGEKVVFLVDTGATRTSIPESVANRIGLRKLDALTSTTAAGDVEVYNTDPIQIGLGRIVMSGVDATINPHFEGEAVLLGMSFLRRTEFKQRDNILVIRQR